MRLQSLYYRCPEVVGGSSDLATAIDMWSVGVVLGEVCGADYFHRVKSEMELVRAWCHRLGSPPGSILQQCSLLRAMLPADPSSPHGMQPVSRSQMSRHVFRLWLKLLSYDPVERPTADAVVNALTHDRRLSLLCEPAGYSDEKVLLPYVPGCRTIFCGRRHRWCITSGNVGADVLDWLLADDCFVPGTVANEVVASALAGCLPKRSKQECDRKLIIAGRVGNCATKSMCGLELEPFVSLHIVAWLAAFRRANERQLSEFASIVCSTIRRHAERYGLNGKHFADTPWREWFLTCGEFVVTKDPSNSDSGGPWVEPKHQDGGQSVFHMGITLVGKRKLVCSQNVGLSDLVLENAPGTVYFGSLTGPEHQVFHQSCSEDGLLNFSAYGPSSVSIMLRTALFPYVRSRTRKGMPYPARLFSLIEFRARQLFATSSFILPSLDECLHFLPEKLADPSEQPLKRMRLKTKTKPVDAAAV
jgi:hypothetical protein